MNDHATMAYKPPGATELHAFRPDGPLCWHEYADAWLNFPPGKVLDYGCGKGDFLRRIADRADERWGVDIDPDVVAEAGRHAGINALQIAPGQPLPFADREFDTVISMEVIEHTADERALLREFARVLAPGGKLLLTTPHTGAADVSRSREPQVRCAGPASLRALHDPEAPQQPAQPDAQPGRRPVDRSVQEEGLVLRHTSICG